MKLNELVVQFSLNKKLYGSYPVAIEYYPEERRLEWIMEDEERRGVSICDDDTPHEIRQAMEHLAEYCETKQLPEPRLFFYCD